MREQQFVIPHRLPGMNEVLNTNRNNRYAGAKLKRETDELICTAIRRARLEQVKSPCIVHIAFFEPNRRRDIDNVESAKKFILDALVKTGVLQGDSPKYVIGVPSVTMYEDKSCVSVSIMDGEDENEVRNVFNGVMCKLKKLMISYRGKENETF